MDKIRALPEHAALAEILRQAGSLALRYFHAGEDSSSKHCQKDDGSPVSEADHAVDAYLHAQLRALMPDAGWLSEETADTAARLQTHYVWIVDPIDGTRDYIHGRGGWCISVALVENGAPVLGMLYAPTTGALYHARHGEGAFLNGVPIRASTANEASHMRYPSNEILGTGPRLSHVPCANSIALRIAMIADNSADALTTVRWGGEWDLVAAHIIAEEAGAVISDAAGQKLAYNKALPRVLGCIVSSPALHGSMVDLFACKVDAFLQKGGI